MSSKSKHITVFEHQSVKLNQVIDGIEYLLVSKTIQDRKFLMRKEALEKIKT